MVPQSESSRGEYRRSLDASNCEFEHTGFTTRVSFLADAAFCVLCRPPDSTWILFSGRFTRVFLRQIASQHPQG